MMSFLCKQSYLNDHYTLMKLFFFDSEIPISGITLFAHKYTPYCSKAFLTSLLYNVLSFLALVTSLSFLIPPTIYPKDISTKVPIRLKKESSLHSNPTVSHTLLVRVSGMSPLLLDDSMSMECTSLLICTSSLDSYSNEGAVSSRDCWCISSSS